jgi:CheY-like chemotaxis protein
MNDYPAVLYVEDDIESSNIMRLTLAGEMKLSNVNIFLDSTDFMARVQKLDRVPDLILLDIHVKPYDGFEMLSMLRRSATYGHVPVVALTASVMSDEVIRLRTAGFSSVIAKPIDIDIFPDLLNRILDGEEIWRIID